MSQTVNKTEISDMRAYKSLGKTIQIDKELFFDLAEAYLFGEPRTDKTDKLLADKLRAIVSRETYKPMSAATKKLLYGR